MPIRPPHPGETERDYVYRYCVPLEINAGRPQRQARAICYSYYRRKTGSKNTQDTQEGTMKEITVRIDDEGIDPSWEDTLVTDGKDLEDWEADFLADLSLTDIKAVMKTEGDGQHPSSHYLVVTDPEAVTTWHLRYRNVSGEIDNRLLGACHAALLDPNGFRGNKYAGPDKQEAIAKLKRLYAQQKLPWPESQKQSTGAEETTTEEGMARQIANAVIRAVSGLVKGGAKEVDAETVDAENEEFEDLDGITPDVDFYPPGTTTDIEVDEKDDTDDTDDSLDESLITWLTDDQVSQYEAPDGYKILGTMGDGEELEFVLEPLEGSKENDEGEDKDDDIDQKAGRRVQGSRVEDLRRLHKEISEALQALDAVIGWADYKDDDQKDDEDLPSQWLSEQSIKALEDHGSVAFSFKARDGSQWWMQWTMNSFRDREGEIFSTKSITDYVDRHLDDDKQGEFWFWHIPGTKFGNVQWQAQVGRFLVQAGPFGDDKVATKFKQFFDAYPDGHPDIAPMGWGTSHRYEYKSTDRQDGVYDWFEIKESTVLPWHEASNPWSPRPHTMEVSIMNEKQKAALEAIGGADFVALIERTGQARTKELEASAIDYKDKTSYASRIRALAKACSDDQKAKLESFCKKLDKQFPPQKPAAPPEEEEEEGEMGKDTAKSDGDKGTDSVDVLKELGKELAALAKEVSGDAGSKLAEIAKEMGGGEKSEKEAKEADGEATPPAEAGSKALDPNLYVTKDDFKDAVGALLDNIREQMTEGFKAIEAKLTTTEAQVTDLARSDEAKIAQKASGVPVASLQEIMSDLLGTGTQIEADSKLAKKGPQQTEQVPGITGVPGLDWMISQPSK